MTRIPELKIKLWLAEKMGGPGPLHKSTRMAPQDGVVRGLHDSRSSLETQWNPSLGDGGHVGGVDDLCYLGHNLFPQNREGQLSLQENPSLLSCTPLHNVPVTQPQPSTQQDPHSYLVLWGHLWLGRFLALRGKGTDTGHPSPTPGLTSSSWLPAVTACLPQLREQSQAVFTCPGQDHKGGVGSRATTPHCQATGSVCAQTCH